VGEHERGAADCPGEYSLARVTGIVQGAAPVGFDGNLVELSDRLHLSLAALQPQRHCLLEHLVSVGSAYAVRPAMSTTACGRR